MPNKKFMLHCDMNNYFASVETIDNPQYKNIPMAVCGDAKTRHGIILAKNDIAKSMGIITGESIFSAKEKVKKLTLITANYDKYAHFAKLSRKIYEEFSDEVIPYGLDEAWINITKSTADYKQAKKIAEQISFQIKSQLSLTISVGVSFNYVFSKLASDMKKPDAITVLKEDDLKTKIWNIPAFEMLFVGPATRKKLKNLGILTIGDIGKSNPVLLKNSLGKVGINLWQFANGDDSSFNPKPPSPSPFKSFGNTITLPMDTTDEISILAMIYALCKVTTARLKIHNLTAKCINLNFKYNNFNTINRQVTLNVFTDRISTIYNRAEKLFGKNYDYTTPIRSIGIHLSNFNYENNNQIQLINIEPEPIKNLEQISAILKNNIDNFNFEKSIKSVDNY